MSTNKRLIDIERPEGPVPGLYLIIIAVLVLLSILILVYALSRPRLAPQPMEIFQITPPAVSAAPAAFTSGNVTVYVPPEAIDREGMISIAPGSPNLFQVAQDLWTRTEVVIVEFLDLERRVVPDITFPNPIEICFRLDEEEWQRFTAQPDAYQVQYYAEDKNPAVWEALPVTTHPDQFQVCGQTDHLSVFGLATKLDAGIPITGPTLTFTPTPTSSAVFEPSATNDRNRRDTATPIKPTSTPRPTNSPPTRTPRPTDPPPPPPTVYP